MPTTRSGEGIGFQDKDTINLEELSNTNGYLPMVQSGINYKVRPTELKRDAVAVCSTASATVGKTATVNNMPDFVLVNGTVITVYFENKNTAAEPTLNINNTGSWPLKLPNQANNIVIGSGCWNDGFIAEVKYVEISDNNKFFLLLGHNVASTNNNYTTLADGTTIYNKAQTDSTINGALANYSEIKYFTMASGKYVWSDSDLEEFILSKIDEIKDRSLITVRNGNTIAVGECIISKQSNIYFSFIFHGYFTHKPKYYVYENGTWTVNTIATENNLINSLAGATTLSKFPIAKTSLSSYMPFKLYLLGGSNHLIIVEGTLSNWNGNVTAFVNVKSDLVSNVSYDNTNEQLVVTTIETCYLGKISIFNPDTWCSIP